jgi:hypothetical protein
MTVRQTAETGWEWEIDGRFYSARAFASTRNIIWSSWRMTGEGPKFEPGFSQPYEDFVRDGAPAAFATPDEVLIGLQNAIITGDVKPKRRWRLF